jgi:HKD family nuclease
MSAILANQSSGCHGASLEEWIKVSSGGFVAVAFLKRQGLARLSSGLQNMLKRGGKLTVVAGTDFWLTEPAALRSLFNLQRRYEGCRLFVFDRAASSTFHPKYYRFRGKEVTRVMIGSANLTRGGMASNIEASMWRQEPPGSDLDREAEEFERSLLGHRRCRAVTDSWLASYEVEHSVQEKERKRAEKAARREMRKITPLDSDELDRFLERYRADKHQQEEFRQRRSNYRIADGILRQKLAGPRKLDQAGFKRHFERLVGTKGEKLWHSGSLYRKKNFLFPRHVALQAVIREVVGNLQLSPAEMYRLGEAWMRQVKYFGPNIFTEICNTLKPSRFAVLNDNPVTSLKHLSLAAFPAPGNFTAEDYQRFCDVLDDLRRRCGFADLGQTDHFLNYIYWKKHKSIS